jgi:tetratricopeptide (TPR) repeat protein
VYAYALINIAEIDLKIGSAEPDVHQCLEKATGVFRSLEYLPRVTYCNTILADLHLRESRLSSASILFQECLRSSWGNDNETMSYCLDRLADISQWSGSEVHQISIWPVIYLGYAHKSKEKLALHKALLYLGDVFLAMEEEDTAQTLFSVAFDGFTYMDIHRSRGECMLRLGDLANKRGDLMGATELWRAAQPLFERSLQVKGVKQIDTRLANVEEAHQQALSHLATLKTVDSMERLSLVSDDTSGIKVLEGTIIREDISPVAVLC